ncbi:MAG: hypothetical protein J6M64_01415, partial [Oscillospiraceae bacterium]|nr:hypothetical protein [Oscillospiraceae bacterium]
MKQAKYIFQCYEYVKNYADFLSEKKSAPFFDEFKRVILRQTQPFTALSSTGFSVSVAASTSSIAATAVCPSGAAKEAIVCAVMLSEGA